MTCNCSSSPCNCQKQSYPDKDSTIKQYYQSQIPFPTNEIKKEDHRPKTIICDIDGTLTTHEGGVCLAAKKDKGDFTDLLKGTLKQFEEWELKGYKIILITGRKESMRKNTESFLASLGIFYDQLIMGVGGGVRVLINDRKSDGRDTAFAINVDRNEGLEGIEI